MHVDHSEYARLSEQITGTAIGQLQRGRTCGPPNKRGPRSANPDGPVLMLFFGWPAPARTARAQPKDACNGMPAPYTPRGAGRGSCRPQSRKAGQVAAAHAADTSHTQFQCSASGTGTPGYEPNQWDLVIWVRQHAGEGGSWRPRWQACLLPPAAPDSTAPAAAPLAHRPQSLVGEERSRPLPVPRDARGGALQSSPCAMLTPTHGPPSAGGPGPARSEGERIGRLVDRVPECVQLLAGRGVRADGGPGAERGIAGAHLLQQPVQRAGAGGARERRG